MSICDTLASVTAPALYYHFKPKNEILYAYLVHYGDIFSLGVIAFYWRNSRHPMAKEEREYLILGDYI